MLMSTAKKNKVNIFIYKALNTAAHVAAINDQL